MIGMNIQTGGHVFEVTTEGDLKHLLTLLSEGFLQYAVWLYAISWRHKRPELAKRFHAGA